ncbi:MAG: hypothetical protein LQ345_004426 [Seirophora villosa]|nr:MAG: hypothetical protein LQ345_004426 [Seirophora villosa]
MGVYKVFFPIRPPWGLSRSSNHAELGVRDSVSISRSSIVKRVNRASRGMCFVTSYIGFGWFCYYNLLDVVVHPYLPAIEEMERFFSTVLSLGNAWAEEPAATIREASIGEIVLRMTSSDPIPWEWILSFLEGAIVWTRAGNVAGFKTTYRSEASGVWIFVELMMPPQPFAAAAARRGLER